MPLPPILEIFVVWHPDDYECGEFVSAALMDHFHSATFAGLAGGAVEVYSRSEGWESPDGPPRPLAINEPWPYGLPKAQFTAVVPILGAGMDRAFLRDAGWRSYLKSIFDANPKSDPNLGVFPLRDPEARLTGPDFIDAVRRPQALHADSAADPSVLCRELSQAIAQQLNDRRGDQGRIRVFVSHTKHASLETDSQGSMVFKQVRQVIASTHLGAFFDAADLQPGTDWEEELDAEAGRCALLMVRTDEYAGREWTQREVHVAKSRDVPIVGLYALRDGEERGSFLMDHVPTVACDLNHPELGITTALGRLVDEALKSELWRFQSVYLQDKGFDWVPVHSPEPVTAVPWLQAHKTLYRDDARIRIIHPDPPLGPREHQVLVDLCRLAGFAGEIGIFTPRTFAARGGELSS